MRGQQKYNEYYISLSKKIRQIRLCQGLSQKEIAESIGVSFQQYQKYEKALNRIPIMALVVFCEMTDTDIKELILCNIKFTKNKSTYKKNVTYNTNTDIDDVVEIDDFF